MNDEVTIGIPEAYAPIKVASEPMSFNMHSDLFTGSLLKTLIASETGGHFLEPGIGTGLATAWIAARMDANSKLVCVDNNALLL